MYQARLASRMPRNRQDTSPSVRVEVKIDEQVSALFETGGLGIHDMAPVFHPVKQDRLLPNPQSEHPGHPSVDRRLQEVDGQTS
jgi:hypothetical protein